MKKIIIVPSNTDLNRGDETLVWESANLIKSVYGDDVEIILIGCDNDAQLAQTRKLGYKFIDRILLHPSVIYENKKAGYNFLTTLIWGGIGIIDFFKTQLLLVKNNFINDIASIFFSKEAMIARNEFQNCDAVFVKGGGFLHSYGGVTDAYLFYYFLFHLLLAFRYNKPVYVLPNSFGPLRNPIAKKLLKKVLNKCEVVYARESVSKECLESEISFKSIKTLDLAFYQKSDKKDFSEYLQKKGVDVNNKNILFTIRPYRFPGCNNADEKYLNYLKSIHNFIKDVQNMGYKVTLFAHTLGPSVHEDDRFAIEELIDRYNDLEDVVYIKDFSLNCTEVQKIYSYYDCIIGTRFHSVIFGLNSCIPTIAITYGGNKGKGIMKDLGLSDYSIPIEEVTGELLLEKFKILIENKETAKEAIYNLLQKADTERAKIVTEIKNTLK